MIDPDNYDRADHARHALRCFLQRTSPQEKLVGPEACYEAVRDLLTDLRHYADDEGLHWPTMLKAAMGMYRTEVREDGGRCRND